MTAGFS